MLFTETLTTTLTCEPVTTTYAKPGFENDGKFCYRVPKGSHCNEDNRSRDCVLFACYIRFGKSSLNILTSDFINTVQTFFSTDIVKYQNQNGGPPGNGVFSATALKRWGEVSGILTFLTLALALMWYYRAHSTHMRRFIKAKQKLAILPIHNGPPPNKRG